MSEDLRVVRTTRVPQGETIEVGEDGVVTDATDKSDAFIREQDSMDRIAAFSWNVGRVSMAVLYAALAYKGSDLAITTGLIAAVVNLAPRLGGVIEGSARVAMGVGRVAQRGHGNCKEQIRRR